jgi:hypothetical protein
MGWVLFFAVALFLLLAAVPALGESEYRIAFAVVAGMLCAIGLVLTLRR